MAGLSNYPGAFDSSQQGLAHYPTDPVLTQILQSNLAYDMSDGVAIAPGVLCQTIPDINATSSLTCTAGTEFYTRVWIPPNTLVTNISFVTAATAASTPTNWWVTLRNSASTVLGVSADQLTTAIAADTAFTVKLGTAVNVGTGGFFYVSIMVAATTGCTIASGVTLSTHGRGAVASTAKGLILAASTLTGQTTPPAVGSTSATLPLGSASTAPGLFYLS